MPTGNQQLGFAIRAVNEAQKALKDVESQTKDVEQAAEKADSKWSKLGSGIKSAAGLAAVGVGALATAGVAAGVGLFKLGESFDDAYDTIAIGTGAMGKDLDALEKNFKNVFRSVPTSMGDAATAVADWNTKVGATDFTLEELSKTSLNLSRITGSDLATNIDSISKLMNQWNRNGEDSATVMDGLFVASQSTGVGVAELADSVTKFGPALRDLGFGMEESIALLGSLEKAGIDGDQAMMGLQKAVVNFAKDGMSAQEGFDALVESIKAAPDEMTAVGLAVENFGSKAGPNLASAIRSGALSVDDLTEAVKNADGIVNQTAESTADFGERWAVMKQKALVALEPVATKVLELGTKGIERLSEFLEENGPKWAAWYQQNIAPAIDKGKRAFDDFVTFVQPKIEQFSKFAQQQFAKFELYYEQDLKPAFDNIKKAVEEIVGWIEDHWGQIEPIVRPIFEQVANVIETNVKIIKDTLNIIVQLLGGDWKGAWEGAKELVDDIMTGVVRSVENAIDEIEGLGGAMLAAAGWLGHQLLQGLKNALSATAGFAGDVGAAVLAAVKSVVNTYVIDPINNALRFSFDTHIPGVGSITIDAPDIPRLAVGARNFAGGLALVGEKGPELVALPRGSDVYTASETRAMAMAGGRGGGVTIVVQGNVYGVDDLIYTIDRALRQSGNAGLVEAA